MQFVDLKKQYEMLQNEIQVKLQAVMARGQFIMGEEVGELEARLAAYVGVKHCISCASGTDALQISLMALGVKPGDEVIVPAFSFIAPAEVIVLLGATPVFIDIDPKTYNLDPAKLEALITPNTKAIIAVSLYGQCADFTAINAIAKKHDIAVIEDAAQSFGATQHNKKSGALSKIGCTSFFPTKPLGGYGDGGAMFTDDETLAASMRMLRAHGQQSRYHHTIIGINSRLDTIQAAILLAKLTLFDAECEKRQAIALRYDKALTPHVTTPHIASGNRSVYGQYTIEVPDRERFAAGLTKASVPYAVHYPSPLHTQPVFTSYALGALPTAENAARHVISLPLHPYLDEASQDQVIQAVKAAL